MSYPQTDLFLAAADEMLPDELAVDQATLERLEPLTSCGPSYLSSTPKDGTYRIKGATLVQGFLLCVTGSHRCQGVKSLSCHELVPVDRFRSYAQRASKHSTGFYFGRCVKWKGQPYHLGNPCQLSTSTRCAPTA